MSLTPLPTPPSTSDPANFATRADAFVAALATMVTEINGGQLPLVGGTVTGPVTFSAGAVIAASQALTGTVGSSTISGFLSIAATTGTFTNVGGTLSTAAQPNVTSVGALNAGSITSGFGSIDVGADAISGGTISGSSLSINSTIANALNFTSSFSGNIVASISSTAGSGGNFGLRIDAGTTSADYGFKIRNAIGPADSFVVKGNGDTVVSGTLDVTGAVTTNGGLQTFGANDSGGAGYRLVVVPNI